MSQTTTTNAAAGRGLSLWASAFVIGALILVQAARVNGAAEMPSIGSFGEVSEMGDFVMLTADGGSDEILIVIDSRAEQIYVYDVQNQQQVRFLERRSLATVFEVAKERGAGRTSR